MNNLKFTKDGLRRYLEFDGGASKIHNKMLEAIK